MVPLFRSSLSPEAGAALTQKFAVLVLIEAALDCRELFGPEAIAAVTKKFAEMQFCCIWATDGLGTDSLGTDSLCLETGVCGPEAMANYLAGQGKKTTTLWSECFLLSSILFMSCGAARLKAQLLCPQMICEPLICPHG